MSGTAQALAALKARRAQQAGGQGPAGPGGESDDGASAPPPPRTTLAWRWTCRECARACVPVREQSRCLCGHRAVQHSPPAAAGHRDAVGGGARCCASGCRCAGFFFIVAEGAWMLRCRCKHKAVEHDAGAAQRRCAKAGCACGAFDSPWVCNCGHAWAAHDQAAALVTVLSVEEMLAQAAQEVGQPVARGGGGEEEDGDAG